MMKKLISLTLVLVMLLSLIACGPAASIPLLPKNFIPE